MPRKTVSIKPGACYHIYNLGYNRSLIFLEPDNYEAFLKLLRKYVAGKHAAVLAYALMPNHYHLLVEPTTDRLAEIMRRLSISYTKAMNNRYQWNGALFDGTFKAELIEGDGEMLELSRHIHRNPLEAGLVNQVPDWQYSSYSEYLGSCKKCISHPEMVLAKFKAETGAAPEISDEELLKLYRQYVETEPNLSPAE